MKVTIDLENLSELVETTLETNISNIVKKEVENCIQNAVDNTVKEEIEKKVSENFQHFVDEYISTTKIQTGGGFWSNDPVKEYTVEEFIKSELRKKLESNTLKVKKKGRTSSYSDDFENVTFEEYIKRNFDASELIKEELDLFLNKIRKQINKTMKDTFDNATKDMLSNAVLNILSSNNTYRQIENNIKCIADKQ